MTENSDFPAPYRAFSFEVNYGHGEPHPNYAGLVELKVTEVWGTSAEVAKGERYVVRGEYSLREERPLAISIAVPGKAYGASAHLAPGTHPFETSAEILEFSERCQRGLGLVLGGDQPQDGRMTTWVVLEEQDEAACKD